MHTYICTYVHVYNCTICVKSSLLSFPLLIDHPGALQSGRKEYDLLILHVDSYYKGFYKYNTLTYEGFYKYITTSFTIGQPLPSPSATPPGSCIGTQP